MRKLAVRSALLCTALFALGGTQAKAQTHIYSLNNTFADQNNSNPLLAAFGGTLTASGYSFGTGQGLSLSSVFGNDVLTGQWTIVFRASIIPCSTPAGCPNDGNATYSKLVDFKTGDDGNGYYIDPFGRASLSPGQDGLDGGEYDLSPDGGYSTTILTRSSTGLFNAWVDGDHEIVDYDDSGTQTAVFSNNIARFFQDDAAPNLPGCDTDNPNSCSNESPAGSVDYIAVYSSVLSDEAIENYEIDREAPVASPEPASLVLLGTGLVGIAGIARRRRSK
jgi:hypothetical protein